MNDRLKLAVDFASEAHGDQRRKYSGRPYVEHPIAVARMVSRFEHDEDMLVAALLHDTVEDTAVTLADVGSAFGCNVAMLVSDLTDVSLATDGNRKSRKQRDLSHTAMAHPKAKTIKLMDLVHNTVSIVRNDLTFARVFLMEKEALLEVLWDASDPRAFALAKRVYARGLDRLPVAPT